jgi:hypothetical protein
MIVIFLIKIYRLAVAFHGFRDFVIVKMFVNKGIAVGRINFTSSPKR